jgi:2-polyprenyl-6-methoxyphenol hydroxylase-like FAD-dependent oxidoreductase
MKSSSIPVLIVGAGPTGLMLALQLARRGVPFRLIDKASGRSETSRALVLHSRTLELLDAMGLVDPFLAAGRKLIGVKMRDEGREIGALDFRGLSGPYPHGLIVPQATTEAILEKALEKAGGVVERPAELLELRLENDGVWTKVQDAEKVIEKKTYRYLAGCDGAHSAVRHSLGIEFPGGTYPEIFGLADASIEGLEPFHLEENGLVQYHPEGVVVLFPLPESGKFRVIARLHGHAAEHGISAEELGEILTRRVGPAVRLGPTDWLTTFRTHHRRAVRFARGHAFLLGDAAHIHSPAGGQGMNTGLQDAINLGWKLASVLQKNSPPNLLETYEAERLPAAEHVLQTTDRMLKVSEWQGRRASLRDRIISAVTRIPVVQNTLAKEVAQQSVSYFWGPLTTEKRLAFFSSSQMRAGDRLPDAGLNLPDGTKVRLADEVRGKEFLLLVAPKTESIYGPDSYGEAKFFVERLLEDFRGHLSVYWLLTPKQSIALREVLPDHYVDLAGEATHALGISPCGVALVRPDLYCAYADHHFDAGSLRLATSAFWT